MACGNYIKLNRSMLKWEWYTDANTKVVFLHAMLKANWDDGGYKGHKLQPGDVVFGRKKWAEELGMSEQQIRTAINHLKETGEISTIKATNKFTILHIENWALYQSSDDETTNNLTNKQPTSNQQATNKQPRTKKEKKEKKEKKDKNIPPKPPYGEIVGHLNMRLGTSYKDNTKKTREHINARFAEGFTLDDFKTVIDKKCVEWANDDKMAKFLRPETLFGTKFESYLNAPVAKREESLWERIERGDFDE